MAQLLWRKFSQNFGDCICAFWWNFTQLPSSLQTAIILKVVMPAQPLSYSEFKSILGMLYLLVYQLCLSLGSMPLTFSCNIYGQFKLSKYLSQWIKLVGISIKRCSKWENNICHPFLDSVNATLFPKKSKLDYFKKMISSFL